MKGGGYMDEFEQLLECDRAAVERFVRYRVSMVHDVTTSCRKSTLPHTVNSRS